MASKTIECGWVHEGIDMRLVMEPTGGGDVSILEVREEHEDGSEVLRPDLLAAAVEAIRTPRMSLAIDRELDRLIPDPDDDGDRAYNAYRDEQALGGRP